MSQVVQHCQSYDIESRNMTSRTEDFYEFIQVTQNTFTPQDGCSHGFIKEYFEVSEFVGLMGEKTL